MQITIIFNGKKFRFTIEGEAPGETALLSIVEIVQNNFNLPDFTVEDLIANAQTEKTGQRLDSIYIINRQPGPVQELNQGGLLSPHNKSVLLLELRKSSGYELDVIRQCLQGVTTLELVCCGLDDALLGILADVLPQCDASLVLQKLDLGGNGLTGKCVYKLVEKLPEYKMLHTFSLRSDVQSGYAYGEVHLPKILEVLVKCRALRIFRLPEDVFDTFIHESLIDILPFSTLEEISFKNDIYSDTSLCNFTDAVDVNVSLKTISMGIHKLGKFVLKNKKFPALFKEAIINVTKPILEKELSENVKAQVIPDLGNMIIEYWNNTAKGGLCFDVDTTNVINSIDAVDFAAVACHFMMAMYLKEITGHNWIAMAKIDHYQLLFDDREAAEEAVIKMNGLLCKCKLDERVSVRMLQCDGNKFVVTMKISPVQVRTLWISPAVKKSLVKRADEKKRADNPDRTPWMPIVAGFTRLSSAISTMPLDRKQRTGNIYPKMEMFAEAVTGAGLGQLLSESVVAEGSALTFLASLPRNSITGQKADSKGEEKNKLDEKLKPEEKGLVTSAIADAMEDGVRLPDPVVTMQINPPTKEQMQLWQDKWVITLASIMEEILSGKGEETEKLRSELGEAAINALSEIVDASAIEQWLSTHLTLEQNKALSNIFLDRCDPPEQSAQEGKNTVRQEVVHNSAACVTYLQGLAEASKLSSGISQGGTLQPEEKKRLMPMSPSTPSPHASGYGSLFNSSSSSSSASSTSSSIESSVTPANFNLDGTPIVETLGKC